MDQKKENWVVSLLRNSFRELLVAMVAIIAFAYATNNYIKITNVATVAATPARGTVVQKLKLQTVTSPKLPAGVGIKKIPTVEPTKVVSATLPTPSTTSFKAIEPTRAQVQANPPAKRPCGGTHTVKSGETAFGIADRQYNIKLAALQAANPSVDLTRIKPGQVLRIPCP